MGITFGPAHTEALYKRLEEMVFRDFQKADQPLFEPGLMMLVGKNKKRTKTAVSCLHLLFSLE